MSSKMMKLIKENVLEPPEFVAVSQLLDELREVIGQPRYDHLTVSQLCGMLEMLKFEYLMKWHELE